MYKFIIFLFFLIIAISCNQEDGVRRYVENNDEPTVSDSRRNEKIEDTDSHLNWTVPDGWVEKRGGGMRLATFAIGNEKKPASCTLVSLKGDGGGIKANIIRWLGQLGLSSALADEAALTRFISDQIKVETSGGLAGLLVDFTPLTISPENQSMLVTIFQLSNQTVFVKLMDKKSVLNRAREDYLNLIRSFRISKGKTIEKN